MFARRRQGTTAPGPAEPAQPVTLSAAGVAKHIDGNVLLRPVDLTVTSGECVVLRGENGSGKTTLLRILAGTLEASDGAATLDGRPIDERDPTTRARVAALIGSPTAYRDLTVIDHLSERFPHELSSGQQHLFHLALVLFRPARVLLLDEPEQRLDTHKRGLLADLLVARKAQGAALVLACHDPALTEAVSDRVVDIAVA